MRAFGAIGTVVLAWLAAAPAGAATFDAGQLDAMLRQDGFASEHPSDNLWAVNFGNAFMGNFPLCLALNADKSALVTYVQLADQAGIDHSRDVVQTVHNLNVSLGRARADFDPDGKLIVHEQVALEDLDAASLRRALGHTGWATTAVFTKVRPALHFSEIKCSPYLVP